VSYTQFFAILRARWLLALSVLLAVVGITAAVSLLLPKQYKASASVVIDVKPDPVSAMIYGGMSSPAFMATQVDIIQSDRVGQRVVRNLKLADNDAVRQQWQDATGGQGTVGVWLADNLQRSLEVLPSRESNVINVSFKAADPRFAAALANAFVQAYIETSLELRVDPARQYSGFFESRAKEAREALEAAQSKLSRFQKDKGIIATDERLDIENSRLNELSSQLVAIQAVTSESNSRQAQARGGAGERMQEVLGNPLISGLKGDMGRSEARLKELNSRYGDNHPAVIEAKASIAELQVRIDEETKRVTGGVGVTGSINRQREAQLRAELESQRGKVLRMKQVRDEGSVLVRDVENAQRSYDAVLARLTQTSLESQTTQSNVNVLTPATPPLVHATPRVALNIAAALFVGTLLAIGAAVLREALDRRVRSVQDVATALNLPVIGILPQPSNRVSMSKRPSLNMKQRLVRQLQGPTMKLGNKPANPAKAH
jgi:polysaccharide biosynthesis transport protein